MVVMVVFLGSRMVDVEFFCNHTYGTNRNTIRRGQQSAITDLDWPPRSTVFCEDEITRTKFSKPYLSGQNIYNFSFNRVT